jgi:FkbM family methyltransferase
MKEIIKQILRSIPIPLTKNHAYDLQTKKVIKTICHSQSNCIDIGCHKGEILDLILKSAPNGKHFAFEPLPDFYENLVTKYHRHNNVSVSDIALSDVKRTTSFNYVVTNPAYSGLIKRQYDRPNEKDTVIEVKTDTLDNIIDPSQKIDFIKIDVEGGEYQVLLGAKNTILRCKPLIIFEHGKGASDAYGTTPENIYDYFEEVGYQLTTMKTWLKKGSAFTKVEFVEEFEMERNYYFVGSPK